MCTFEPYTRQHCPVRLWFITRANVIGCLNVHSLALKCIRLSPQSFLVGMLVDFKSSSHTLIDTVLYSTAHWVQFTLCDTKSVPFCRAWLAIPFLFFFLLFPLCYIWEVLPWLLCFWQELHFKIATLLIFFKTTYFPLYLALLPEGDPSFLEAQFGRMISCRTSLQNASQLEWLMLLPLPLLSYLYYTSHDILGWTNYLSKDCI